MNTSRRQFLAVSGTAAVLGPALVGETLGNENEKNAGNETVNAAKSESLYSSAVVLQNPTETGIQAVWTVTAPATGWVEWGMKEDALDQKSCGAIFGLKPYSDRVIQIPISGLKPNTTYYYRAATSAVDFRGAYDIRPSETVEYTPIRSFTTPGPAAKTASFAVVNDTHQVQDLMAWEFDKIAELRPDYTLWNGDSVHSIENHDMLVKCVMFPAKRAYADDHPLLFVRGNHDTRGVWARYYPEYFTPWEHDEPEFAGLGYSYVVRHGDLAMICLDTGEDKPDFRKEWGGLAEFEPYIAKQGEWLRSVLASEAVKTAKFVVAFCHIPLFDPRPKANPGTLETGYSSWKKLGADCWGPALQEAGVQLVVCAHMHRHRVDAPTAERCWTQVVGGGCAKKDATVIYGKVENDRLKLDVYAAETGDIITSLEFEPRK